MKDFRHTGRLRPATEAFIDFDVYVRDGVEVHVARCAELPKGYVATFYPDGDGYTIKTRSPSGVGSIRYDRGETREECMDKCRKWVVRKIREVRRES